MTKTPMMRGLSSPSCHLAKISAVLLLVSWHQIPSEAILSQCLVQAGNQLAAKLHSLVGGPVDTNVPYDYYNKYDSGGKTGGQNFWNWMLGGAMGNKPGAIPINPNQYPKFGYSYPIDNGYTNRQPVRPSSNWVPSQLNQPYYNPAMNYQSGPSKVSSSSYKSPTGTGSVYPYSSTAPQIFGRSYDELRANYTRFLGFGRNYQLPGGSIRLVCRFDEPLTHHDSSISNVEWAKFVGAYQGAQVVPPYECPTNECQVSNIGLNGGLRFRPQQESSYRYSLTIDDYRPAEDNGYYRCSARKLNFRGQPEIVYRIVGANY